MLSIIYIESRYNIKTSTDWIRKSKMATIIPSERKKWNSEKMIELREKHIDGNLEDLSLCQNCNMYQPHPALVVGNSLLDYTNASRLVPQAETIISKLRY